MNAVERQQRRAVDEARDVLRRLVREAVRLLDEQLHGQAPVAREPLLRRSLHGSGLVQLLLARFWSLPHAATGAMQCRGTKHALALVTTGRWSRANEPTIGAQKRHRTEPAR